MTVTTHVHTQYTHTYTHICIHTYLHTYVHTAYVCMCVCIYIHTHIHSHINGYLHIYTHTHSYLPIFCTHTCTNSPLLRQLRTVSHSRSHSSLVHTFVASRNDYCSSLYASMPALRLKFLDGLCPPLHCQSYWPGAKV